MDRAGSAITDDGIGHYAASQCTRPVVRSFEPWHAEAICLREIDRKTLRAFDPVALMQSMARMGPFYTCFIGEEIMFISGVFILWPGVGEAWSAVSDLVERYPLFYTKTVRTYLDQIIQDYRLHRLQAQVVAYHTRSLLWVKLLGFKLEAVLKQYGPNREDHYLFARLS